MKTETILALTTTFEGHDIVDQLVDVNKTIESAEKNRYDHFVAANRMVESE